MPQPRCHHCGLPVRIHFAFCAESGIVGKMAPEALAPNAIKFEPGELRQPPLSAWKAKHGKRA
ncbi:MAG: hypothetical protein P4M15_07220 [Alphaproteobacteria bacterium]|nr:hypothetical protein [Alphaproteobacteria bacterium]